MATYGAIDEELGPKAEEGAVDHEPIQVVDDAFAEEPPTITSAYQNMRQAHSFNDRARLAGIIVGMLCTNVLISVILSLVSLIPLYMLIVGTVHLNDCTIDRRIPIYLIVDAVMFFARSIILWCYRCIGILHISKSPAYKDAARPAPMLTIINLFLFIWLICGSVWIFGNSPDFHNTQSPNYCDKLTYVSAYVYIILQWIALPIVLIFGFCIVMACCALFPNGK